MMTRHKVISQLKGVSKMAPGVKLNYGYINAFYCKTFLNHATDIDQLRELKEIRELHNDQFELIESQVFGQTF
jgi:hypothetical protein